MSEPTFTLDEIQRLRVRAHNFQNARIEDGMDWGYWRYIPRVAWKHEHCSDGHDYGPESWPPHDGWEIGLDTSPGESDVTFSSQNIRRLLDLVAELDKLVGKLDRAKTIALRSELGMQMRDKIRDLRWLRDYGEVHRGS